MTFRTRIAMFAGALATLLFAGVARADLIGDQMTISITHAGLFEPQSALNDVSYTYGSPSVFNVPAWGSLTITSPEPVPGFDNAMKVDFTAFSYSAFTGPFATTGTIKILDLDEAVDLASVQILVNGTNIASGVAAVGNGFQASWNTQTVFNGNPVAPNITVAWNSVPVPAPGAMALLGLASLVSARGRRRR